ncbi:MAG: ATPase, T2SS/T4P/T4SS family, partial [Candidatus Pacebacteria bacterium]|nr:ATPase, T2SS/T4P/T4SS family [Candidatus Paceibacterota bacterium]
KVNITTIEDPVEYKIAGINQIQVSERTNLTFANGLRSIIRQDPDIILVGEIRDKETAEISVNSALTGHLLLSTFHANDAATALPRLLDIGIEPFLLSSTLEVIVSQRLARKICEKCRYSHDYSLTELKKMFPVAKDFFKGKETLYLGKGCSSCNGTGLYGSTAIFEIIKITSKMKELILKNPTSNEVWKLAYSQGSRPMFEDGLEKVRNGIITMEELLRIAKPLDL